MSLPQVVVYIIFVVTMGNVLEIRLALISNDLRLPCILLNTLSIVTTSSGTCLSGFSSFKEKFSYVHQ